MLRLIHDKCHVMQQLFALCLEIPLIEIIKCQEIPETDILKISPDRAVNPNPRQSDWVLREITEPCQCLSAFTDLQCSKGIILLMMTHDKDSAFPADNFQLSPAKQA